MNTTNKYLKQAQEAYKGKTRKLDLTLKAEEAIASLYGNNPQGYGARIQKFITENTCLNHSSPRNNAGDGVIYTKSRKYSLSDNLYVLTKTQRFVEIKVSYPDSDDNSTFAIIRLKPTQKLDYFILCLVDIIIPEGQTGNEREPSDFIGYFYCLPAWYVEKSDDFKRNTVNGTEDANKNNKDNETRFTVKKEDAFEKFGKHNLLRGTSFEDLKEYLEYLNNDEPPQKEHSINDSIDREMSLVSQEYEYCGKRVPHKSPERFALEVNGVVIKGRTNPETVLKFIDHIGIENATSFFTNTYLSQTPSSARTIEVFGTGYYLSKIISGRDMKGAIRRGYEKLNIKVNLI